MTHILTGLKLTASNGFLAVESAKGLVDKTFRKADWTTLGPDNPPLDLEMAVTEIWNEMIVEDYRMMGALPIIDRFPWPSDGNPFKHVGRHDPCPCVSGKKNKKCCLQ